MGGHIDHDYVKFTPISAEARRSAIEKIEEINKKYEENLKFVENACVDFKPFVEVNNY